jgi:hypothetical protein
MQNQKGGVAGGMVSSEMAAMTGYGMLPDMAELEQSAQDRGSSWQCQLLGQQLGYNQTVFYPIWISLDNATIHPHARKRMLQR